MIITSFLNKLNMLKLKLGRSRVMLSTYPALLKDLIQSIPYSKKIFLIMKVFIIIVIIIIIIIFIIVIIIVQFLIFSNIM